MAELKVAARQHTSVFTSGSMDASLVDKPENLQDQAGSHQVKPSQAACEDVADELAIKGQAGQTLRPCIHADLKFILLAILHDNFMIGLREAG